MFAKLVSAKNFTNFVFTFEYRYLFLNLFTLIFNFNLLNVILEDMCKIDSDTLKVLSMSKNRH